MTATETPEGAFEGIPLTQKAKRRSFDTSFHLALAWIVVVAVCAAFAEALPVQDPLAVDTSAIFASPGASHWFGADGLGRDLLSRVVFGARVSLVVGVVSVSVGLLVGTMVGIVAGFFGGMLERMLMASIDVMLAFPNLVLLLAIVAFVGRGFMVIALTVGFLSIPTYARVARASALASTQREFVLAARGLGAPTRRILFREVLPNALPPVLAWAFIAMALVIVLEGSLAFLGLGIPPPTPTWGSMIAEGKAHLANSPHVVLFPSLFMFLTVLSFNYVGETMRRRIHHRGSAL